jgi:anaerobic selenocysteine-containing dehydrogenase
MIEDGSIEWDYVREQTDLPFLVRTDNRKFLRLSDIEPGAEGGDTRFYIWDETADALTRAAATGFGQMAGRGPEGGSKETLALGDRVPALEGRWTVQTASGPVEVTTVFELTREMLQGYTPERAQEITGVHADNIREVARKFASAKPGMIFSGYRSCKWLHGDKLHRAWLLMTALTGNTGREGGGVQTTQLPRGDGLLKYTFNGVGPRLKVAAISIWDYAHAGHEKTNREAYGDQFADKVAGSYREAIQNGWLPDYGKIPWKMGIMAGHNPANWRATGKGWRDSALLKLETIVTMTPNMSVTAMYSDYVLPIADHYEREDYVMEGRTPYVQVIDKAVAPLGDSVDDFEALQRLMKAISARAAARKIPAVKHTVFGQPVESDYARRTSSSSPWWVTMANRCGWRAPRKSPSTLFAVRRACRKSAMASYAEEGHDSCRRRRWRAVRAGLRLQLLRAGAHPRQEALRNPDRPPAVLLRSRLVPAGRRGPAGAPCAARGEGLWPAPDHGSCAPRRAQHVPGRFRCW